MDNNNVLPFERNRYYTGKLLTANDFSTEQSYNSSKRRFINNLMFGSGVVCGLGVYNLDDLSVIIESGVAIDNFGREVVLENSVVKKLSTIDGFEKLESDSAVLYICYEEEETHPVFSVNNQSGEDYQCNSVKENYKFLLLDSNAQQEADSFETEFLNRTKLYQDNDYSIYIAIPANVSIGSDVRVEVEIKKISDEEKMLNAEFTLITPAFANERMEHEIKVKLENMSLEKGQELTKPYWISVGVDNPMKTSISVEQNSVKILSGTEETKYIDKFSLATEIVMESEYDIVSREIGKISLESRNPMSGTEYIRIADIQLIRTDSLFIIGMLEDKKAKKYIKSNANEQLRRKYFSYYNRGTLRSKIGAENSGQTKLDFSNIIREQNSMTYATGILEIPLDVKQKSGDIVFSDEIIHGLGKGNVYVDIGAEYVADDKTINAVVENVVYGDATLFENTELPFSQIETAVKVMPGKGSFIAAVRLLKETDLVLLKFRWNAIKFSSDERSDMLNQLTDMRIVAETPTIVLGTKESHFFKIKFSNMTPCSINYQLTEENSGSISSDGIYTAPAKEGVFEILITCVEYPLVSTYAYAVVKRKGNE